MLDLLNGDNDAEDRYTPIGAARIERLSLDNVVTNAKRARVGLFGGSVNGVMFLEGSDSLCEAVGA